MKIIIGIIIGIAITYGYFTTIKTKHATKTITVTETNWVTQTETRWVDETRWLIRTNFVTITNIIVVQKQAQLVSTPQPIIAPPKSVPAVILQPNPKQTKTRSTPSGFHAPRSAGKVRTGPWDGKIKTKTIRRTK